MLHHNIMAFNLSVKGYIYVSHTVGTEDMAVLVNRQLITLVYP